MLDSTSVIETNKTKMWCFILLLLQLEELTISAQSQNKNFTLNSKDVQVLFNLEGKNSYLHNSNNFVAYQNETGKKM